MIITSGFIKKSILAIIIGGLIVVQYFFYIDYKNDCYIKILPALTEFSNLNIKRSIKVLKAALPEQYQMVCQNVDTVSPNLGCGGLGGGCYYQGEPEIIYISTTQNDLIGSAAIIVHETCHVIQAKKGQTFNEDECYLADDIVFRELAIYE